MKYLVSVIDDGQAAAAGDNASATESEIAAIDEFNAKLQADGHFVFACGLAAPHTAAVVDNRGAAPVVTEGPYVTTDELVAGLWIIEAPDRDVAMNIAARASRACNRKLEVRELL